MASAEIKDKVTPSLSPTPIPVPTPSLSPTAAPTPTTQVSSMMEDGKVKGKGEEGGAARSTPRPAPRKPTAKDEV